MKVKFYYNLRFELSGRLGIKTFCISENIQ
jgi:hypothetical protein